MAQLKTSKVIGDLYVTGNTNIGGDLIVQKDINLGGESLLNKFELESKRGLFVKSIQLNTRFNSSNPHIKWCRILSYQIPAKQWESLYFSITLVDAEQSPLAFNLAFSGRSISSNGYFDTRNFAYKGITSNDTSVIPLNNICLTQKKSGLVELWLKPAQTYIWLNGLLEYSSRNISWDKYNQGLQVDNLDSSDIILKMNPKQL